MRKHPLLQVRRFHNGLDFAASLGEPVKAAAKGKVAYAEPLGEFGNVVRIDHGDGLATVYAHLSGIAVRIGDCVSEGSVVGHAGSTGLSARTGVHFEAQVVGKPVDPAPAIGEPTPRR
jgi:murein DD-endopeptidase MepM/ murein hydrolase activator NlpD